MNLEQALDAFEIRAEREIETVVQRLVLDQTGACQKIEVVDAGRYDVVLQRIEQRQELTRADRQLGRLEMEEKVDQHNATAADRAGTSDAAAPPPIHRR